MLELFSYTAFGLRISSCIRLPLIETTVLGNADIVVSHGPIPDKISGNDEHVVHVPGVAKYYICSGKTITIAREPGIADADVAVFLLNRALSILLDQRGMPHVYGSTVYVNGQRILIIGLSAFGKSALAAALTLKGATCFTDEIAVVKLRNSTPPEMLSGYPFLSVWHDSLVKLGLQPDHYIQVRGTLLKYYITAECNELEKHTTLDKIYILVDVNKKTLTIDPLTGKEKFKMLRESQVRLKNNDNADIDKQYFQFFAGLAAHVPVYTVKRHVRYMKLPEVAGMILEHIRNS